MEVDEKFKQKIAKPWKQSVVVKMLGKEIGFLKCREKAGKQRKPKKGWKVIDLERNYYLVQFDSKDNYMHVSLDRPWIVLGLPVHLYHKKVLRALRNKIGRLVKINYNTTQCDMAHFAKISVEVDLTKSLIFYFEFKGKTEKVAYEGLPNIFFHCGKFGHTINLYGDNPANVNKPPNESNKAANSGGGGGEIVPTEDIFMVPG
ncbi:uncharacterized protein LOC132612043 [Lycium barbarum]|uniref:uncharacterized protein LOC132612043 n=1 Tax=Lycium barbarum TaxID=112863 RepID=UPI00293E6775|nr:uncharacterized protein LOC132612043 [Lycium barbarum]